MDPMLEIARGFLRSEREAASKVPLNSPTTDFHSRKIFPDHIYKDIDSEIKQLYTDMTPTTHYPNITQTTHSHNSLHVIKKALWESRDERVQEILAHVFYARPLIARKLCEVAPQLIPEFVHYVADEARRQWQIERSSFEFDRKKKLQKMFEKYEYVVHETFPDAFELYLIEKPKFMEEIAFQLRVALPFSMVLKKELDEIDCSRKVRLRCDRDAITAQIMDETSRLQSRLDHLRESSDQGVIQRERDRLQKEKDKLEEFFSDKQSASSRDGPSLVPGQEEVSPKKEPSEDKTFKQSAPSGDGPSLVSGQENVSPKKEPSESETFNFPPIRAEEMSLFGLALSGGGIRSATFNLGVLQGLADLDLLRRLDYLSGVSGGSHLAAWLGAWIKREPEGIRRVQRWLSPLRSPTPDTGESNPIQFLRRFSNYLAPRKGILSADTWSIFSIWLRNTILNQIVFILLLASLLMTPKLVFAFFHHSPWFQGNINSIWLGLVTMSFTVVLAVLIGMNLRHFDPGVQSRIERRRTPFALWTQFGVQTTVVLGSIVLSSIWAAILFYKPPLLSNGRIRWIILSLALMVTLWTMHMASGAWHLFLPQRLGEVPNLGQKTKAIGAVLLVSTVSALVGGAMLYGALHIPLRPGQPRDVALMVVFGPVLVIGIMSSVMLLHIGLMGRNLPDNRREWWGRLGATLLIALAGWIALSACAFWGADGVSYLLQAKSKWKFLPALLWVTITAFGAKRGFRAQTPPHTTDKSPADLGSFYQILQIAPREWIALIAPYFYIAGLAMLLSFLLYKIVPQWFPKSNLNDYAVRPAWLLLLPVMLVLAVILAWRFDVNEFSMHSFYRNRLVRCYLGASRGHCRNPNPFTGFDSEDDMRLSLLRVDPPVPKDLSRAARPYHGPFLIFNTALNLVAGKELAWQERKAASFVFTPLYCGYELAHGAAYHQTNFANFGYRPTVDYAESDLLGPSLGTSMAISGAAANPNMGYHYSPALSFLMALFNVRLGCWMGNPRHRSTWRRYSPVLGLAYLVNELIGGTNDTSRFINLSDGGHFENLGIYELVRRHCMYIIVCDAEEDLPFSFQGLSSAIRKCRADFGIDIRLDPDQLRPVLNLQDEHGRSRAHCALGDIVYSPERIGKLLYIKTSLTGDEPGDVLGYKLRHAAFPHQSTADQFFDESQFESYRALGQHISMAILQRASEYAWSDTFEKDKKSAIAGDAAYAEMRWRNKEFLKNLFCSLNAMWYPPTASMVALRERHRDLYDQLIGMFLSSDKTNLDAAARTFFRTSQDPTGPFLAYSKMIQLMHRVFQDLDLEIMSDHPHNEGWMNIFRGWAGDERFRNAWEITRDNYDNRFKIFCEKELDLQSGATGSSAKKKPA